MQLFISTFNYSHCFVCLRIQFVCFFYVIFSSGGAKWSRFCLWVNGYGATLNELIDFPPVTIMPVFSFTLKTNAASFFWYCKLYIKNEHHFRQFRSSDFVCVKM